MDLFVRETCVETVISFAVMFDDASGAQTAHFSFYTEKLIQRFGILILRALESHCQIAIQKFRGGKNAEKKLILWNNIAIQKNHFIL